MQSTPVRDLGTVSASGVRLLRDVGSTYRDGAEEVALQIVSAAKDRSAASDEMVRAAVGWAQRYHFDPARANIVRCLDLPPTARVLEIGAGCGAVTRYLGERCAAVDALEPVQARAEVARVRTADLPHVDVVVGMLADVPAQPTYDVVVVIGVLEYVADGAADLAPYKGFLDDVAARLVDGGTLVLAIENRLGVKYVVGAPEDHTNRVFDSIEGYPRGGRARTFSRRELEELVAGSGLQPVTRVAFPDYKIPRAVFGELPATTRSLLHRIPEFPSPDWRAQRPRLADERSVWRTLVDAGLDREFGNSFLVLAGKGAPSGLWPDGRGAMFWSSNRLPHLMTQTAVEIDGDSVRFRRTVAGPHASAASTVRVVESDVPYVAGTDLPVVIADAGLAAAGPLLTEWQRQLDAAAEQDPLSLLDFVPHNMIVDAEGETARHRPRVRGRGRRPRAGRAARHLLARAPDDAAGPAGAVGTVPDRRRRDASAGHARAPARGRRMDRAGDRGGGRAHHPVASRPARPARTPPSGWTTSIPGCTRHVDRPLSASRSGCGCRTSPGARARTPRPRGRMPGRRSSEVRTCAQPPVLRNSATLPCHPDSSGRPCRRGARRRGAGRPGRSRGARAGAVFSTGLRTEAALPIKVSVVVPVWNPGPNIQRCLDGLLAQTMSPRSTNSSSSTTVHRRDGELLDAARTGGPAVRMSRWSTSPTRAGRQAPQRRRGHRAGEYVPLRRQRRHACVHALNPCTSWRCAATQTSSSASRRATSGT